ncbi:LacI family DNA-binding transcriptional regulator [Salinibacterium sp. G-O1]|uniref:LacI family DNA-binding transcriptional regulator n=1 Tax=Salinibacterium sp. G-O1 TaxID=3046208 RepID=UPI0024BA74FB|nr:LacI family DNA-binding transcriptional regulator [Salinibacterium sp. G-O1]MDJ0334068.1 LacI family DNA-binding transcriptional regulator [Salinibacterium sp. G-O1]
MERRPARLSDVAHRAGVSVATASRALNGSARSVKESNRAVVLAAADELGYTANVAAQAVARGRHRGVTLLVKSMPNDYANPMVVGVVEAARRAGIRITLVVVGEKSADLVREVHAARAQRAEILMTIGGRTIDDRGIPDLVAALQQYEAEGGRVVMITQAGLPFDTVSYDNQAGAHDLAVELLALGYEHFAILAGYADGMTQLDRTRGFVEGLAEGGVTLGVDRIITGEFTRDGAYAATGDLLRRGIKLDAIFAVNDAMALGVLTFLRDSGERGKGIAVAGFDDIASLRDITPGLTTVHLPWDAVATEALRLAQSDRAATPRHSIIGAHVVIRESTPPRR